jgi:hypothetical protein
MKKAPHAGRAVAQGQRQQEDKSSPSFSPDPLSPQDRQTYRLRFRGEPGVNADLAIRGLLKVAGRRFRLRCLTCGDRAVSNASATGGCRSRPHWRDRWAIYDALPAEVRDRLKIARADLCAGCIRNRLRKQGLKAVLHGLDFWRTHDRECRDREVWLVPREELRP